MAAKDPWYKDGLSFECTQCGGCCSGAPGAVWVDNREVKAMADRLEMEESQFRHQFVRSIEGRESLVEYPDGDCIFLDPETRGCLVYEVRPIQCQTWPFWDSNLKSKRAWSETCRICPGSGVGKLYPLDKIEHARLRREL
mgnify:CR=1 FL=1